MPETKKLLTPDSNKRDGRSSGNRTAIARVN